MAGSAVTEEGLEGLKTRALGEEGGRWAMERFAGMGAGREAVVIVGVGNARVEEMGDGWTCWGGVDFLS